ncbi:LysR family transcriptional regulator [Pseudomonas sp. P867]|uniref:LysR family transcriptional regulator n=1 Tax=Pseudomonas sp. P867 TaxID=2816050 RepID=UPI001CA6634A|nr:LysR family transcriptional regulator [Pseudomonas sp. P867]MBY8972741.1 LysR family transcriptional regulator [Pseudomonas sp. P867]
MKKTELPGLVAFVTIAKEHSFRRAAAKLGVTPPTLSHAMRELEAQLGIRLLSRTTRNVSPTEAGTYLLGKLAPAFTDIETALEGLNAFRDQPHGLVRISAPRTAIELVIVPQMRRLASDYPGISLEIVAQEQFTNIVEQGFDAGIRLGKDLQNDMRAVRVTSDQRFAIVATPEYFRRYGKPQHPEDLLNHRCIGWRKSFSGELYKWEFQKKDQIFSVAVNSPLILDDARVMVQAALAHVGIAFALEQEVAGHIAAGYLERVIADWCPAFPGFYLYYPNRRNHPVALTTVIDMLRFLD